MKKTFFNLVDNDFFQILNSKYKEIYYELLIRINEKMNIQNDQLERSEIIELIEDYFSSTPMLQSFEYDDNEELVNFKKKPSDLLRRLEETGWLSSEPTSDFKVVYQMEPAAIAILSAMEKAVKDDDRPGESTAFVYNIYSSLENFEFSEATGIVEQLDRTSDLLNDNMRMINSRIKKYLKHLLDTDRQDPKKILYELLDNYQNNVVGRTFYNLRTIDNPTKYSDQIIKDIEFYEREKMPELISNYISVKCNGVRNDDTLLEARVFFHDIFRKLKNQFKSIASKIEVLEQRNSSYVTNARSRVMFLLNDKDNIEGKVDNILRLIEDKKIKEDEEFEFDIYDKSRIDDSSLYTYVKNIKTVTTVETKEQEEVDPEILKRYLKNLGRLKKFNIQGVNKFIVSKLEGKEEIEAKDIKIHDFDEFVMIFLARIYSQDKNISYKVKQLDDECIYLNHKIPNFVISWRNKK